MAEPVENGGVLAYSRIDPLEQERNHQMAMAETAANAKIASSLLYAAAIVLSAYILGS